MAQVHNALRRGGFSRALKNALGDTKAEEGLERYGETLQPVIDLWRRPEFAWLRKERLWARSTTVGATVAENSAVAIVNQQQDCLVVVTRITIGGNSAATNFFLGPTNATLVSATLASLFAAIGTDERAATEAAGADPETIFSFPQPQFFSGSDPSIVNLIPGANVWEKRGSPADTDSREFHTGPWILKQNTGIIVFNNTQNQAFDLSASGYTRQAFPSEFGL